MKKEEIGEKYNVKVEGKEMSIIFIECFSLIAIIIYQFG